MNINLKTSTEVDWTFSIDSAWVLVRIMDTQGSTPRATGAWMLVQARRTYGSIGGGNLEWQAKATAHQLLAQWQSKAQKSDFSLTSLILLERSYSLGPQLGQCCGGRLTLRFELLTVASYQSVREQIEAQRIPLALFGLGHIGMALVQLLQNLPFATLCFDSRPEAVAALAPQAESKEHKNKHGLAWPTQGGGALQAGSVAAEWVQLPADAPHCIAQLPSNSILLIMSHSHAEDFALCKAALQRQRTHADVLWIGLIGSASKWQGFQKRLLEQGFTEQEITHIVSPIGVAGIAAKEPAALAVSVAAQLLQLHALWKDRVKSSHPSPSEQVIGLGMGQIEA